MHLLTMPFILYAQCDLFISICSIVHLYIIMVCTDGITISMSTCVLLAATGIMFYWLTDYCAWCVSM